MAWISRNRVLFLHRRPLHHRCCIQVFFDLITYENINSKKINSITVNAATGILVAIAIPVPLHEQSVFVSYNFEGNYNMPNVAPDSFPGPIDRWTIQNNTPFPIIYGDPEPGGEGTADDVVARKLDGTSSNTTAGASTNEGTTDDARKLGEISSNKTAKASTEKHKVERRSSSDREIFTRRGAYQLIESRLDS